MCVRVCVDDLCLFIGVCVCVWLCVGARCGVVWCVCVCLFMCVCVGGSSICLVLNADPRSETGQAMPFWGSSTFEGNNFCVLGRVVTFGFQVTWGHPLYGGDSRAAQCQLVQVQHVHAAETAFAAIREDGSTPMVPFRGRHFSPF